MMERKGKIDAPRPDEGAAEDRAVLHGLEEDEAPDDRENDPSHRSGKRAFLSGGDRLGRKEGRPGHQLSVDQKDEKGWDDEKRGDGGGLRKVEGAHRGHVRLRREHVVVAADEHRRAEVGERANEDDQRRRDDARAGERKRDAEQRLPPSRAEVERGLFKTSVDAPEHRHYQERGDGGQPDGLHQNDAVRSVRVPAKPQKPPGHEPSPSEEHDVREGGDERRGDQRQQEHPQHRPFPPEGGARHVEGAAEADQHRKDGCPPSDEEAVLQQRPVARQQVAVTLQTERAVDQDALLQNGERRPEDENKNAPRQEGVQNGGGVREERPLRMCATALL